jgi:hypothetical protein
MLNSLVPVMNDTKWDELRLAMYSLGRNGPQFRTKKVGASQPGPWDGEWYYHFRVGGYRTIEWVELKLRDATQRDIVANALAIIGLPGTHTEAGFIIYGYVVPGIPVDYIRSLSDNSSEHICEE